MNKIRFISEVSVLLRAMQFKCYFKKNMTLEPLFLFSRRSTVRTSDTNFFNSTNSQWINYEKDGIWDDSIPLSRRNSTDADIFNNNTSSSHKRQRVKTIVRPKSNIIDVKPFTVLSNDSTTTSGRNSGTTTGNEKYSISGNTSENEAVLPKVYEVLPGPVIVKDTIVTGSNYR
jgi:hypothetical protein